jgi:inhibitor of KinA sporulation pathway (predicted exonuclease)
MQLLIVDIEATCWEGDPPPEQESEIIEIGICPLSLENGEVGSKRSILVRPQRSTLSEFCTTLTTLTQAQVDEGVLFDQACQTLCDEFDSKNTAWASWGEFDRKMFTAQCRSFQVEYPFSSQHLNVKKLFRKVFREKKPLGMAQALARVQLPLTGTHHRGDDDAYNIARIAAVILQQRGREIFPF